ncbi:hypothetical protein OL229_11055 [Neisseriaceae bacterium JH1-16]|nr:hypothetical protein [Neisseriaceae bacterium JH1-16]
MKRAQQGRTLLELMLVMALTMLLLALILPVLLGSMRLALEQEQGQAMQQDARLALTTLLRDLRMAGQFGCFNLASGDSLAGSPPWPGASGFGGGGALRLQYGQAGAVLTALERDAAGGQLHRLTARLSDGGSRLGDARFLVLASCRGGLLIDAAGMGQRVGADGYRLELGGVTVSPASGSGAGHPAEQLELLRLVSRVYAVGRYGGRQGLYLFELGDNGNWQGPIELAPGVSALTVVPIRSGDCPAARLWQVTLDIEDQDDSPASGGHARPRRYMTRVAGRGEAGCDS